MIPRPRPSWAPAPAAAGSPPPAPPIPIAQSPRYAYLVNRLVARQITMEEATELFESQQRMVAVLSSPPPPPPPSGTNVAPPASPEGSLGMLTDEALTYGLIGIGAAAGLLAALLRRSQELRSPPTVRGKAPSR